ncbi:MAG: hypothetical protein ABEJ78_11250, partial [Haloferacaceae archaeon]
MTDRNSSSDTDRGVSRRKMLQTTGAGAALASMGALAGCSGGGGGGGDGGGSGSGGGSTPTSGGGGGGGGGGSDSDGGTTGDTEKPTLDI